MNMADREKRRRMDTIEVRLLCGEGGDHLCGGEMECISGITQIETKWLHRCPKCGHEAWKDHSYPYVEYVPVK